SALAAKLVAQYPDGIQVDVVCFDDILPAWIGPIPDIHSIKDIDERYNDARRRALATIEQLLNNAAAASASQPSPSSLLSPENEREKEEEDVLLKRVIIVDDNMYYRSMRKQVFQISSRHFAQYRTVVVECPDNVAKRRLSERSPDASGRTVTPETIDKMATLLETPWDSPDDFEHEWIRVNGSSIDEDELSAQADAVWRTLVDEHPSRCRRDADRRHREQLQHEQRAKDREATSGSIKHAVNIALNRAINTVLKEPNGTAKRTYKELASIKDSIMQDLFRHQSSSNNSSRSRSRSRSSSEELLLLDEEVVDIAVIDFWSKV
ncbi:hypothetical protein GQ42DRAFT_169276, partial [Ramicandelaber brevisporus]